jgi:UDP-N-acetylmuramoylalanine--D-glutamate ligase
VYHRSVPRIGGVAALSGKRVAVFGAGMEGQSFARRIGPSCSEIVVLDDLAGGRPASGGPGPSALGADLADLNVRSPAVLAETRFDFVVHSPGVSRFDERLAEAMRLGAVVTTPTALFMEDFADRQVVAVTGSKGKTTTAMLTVAVLRAYGLEVALAGNIGRPVTELYDDGAHDVFVVELSSFQAAEVTTSPTVGVLTLLAPDHLDWHRSIENYYGDKLRLFSQRSDVPVAVNGCCDQAVALSSELGGRVLYGEGGPVRLEGSRIVAAELGPLELGGFRLLGGHNLLNACGAITAGMLLTGDMPDRGRLEHELCTVTAPRARLEPIGSFGGVSYIDDALASNPDGTIAALRVFAGRQVALIVGGFDRGLDYEPLARAIESGTPRPVVFWTGPAGKAIAAALERMSGAAAHEEVASLEAAVAVASRMPGIEVVLFSPASPTPHDEGTYFDRGERFRQAAAARATADDSPPATGAPASSPPATGAADS